MTAATSVAEAPKKAAPRRLRDVITEDYRTGMPLTKALFVAARKRGLGKEDSEDTVQETWRVALKHEDDGQPWNPPDDVKAHLLRIQDNLFAERRRKYRKLPMDPLPEDQDVASLGPTPEVVVLEEHDRRSLAQEIRRQLAAETRGGLTLRILDLMDAGVHGHDSLAQKLACKLADIRNGLKRIQRRKKIVYAAAGWEEAS